MSAMPVIRAAEKYTGMWFPLVDGLTRTIGWQWQPEAKGGPIFVVISRRVMGGYKIVERFPLTADDWTRTWNSLAAADPGAAQKVLAALRAREAAYAQAARPAELDSAGAHRDHQRDPRLSHHPGPRRRLRTHRPGPQLIQQPRRLIPDHHRRGSRRVHQAADRQPQPGPPAHVARSPRPRRQRHRRYAVRLQRNRRVFFEGRSYLPDLGRRPG